MLAPDRRSKIKDELLEKKSVTVSDMSAMFGVTDETIRRDLRTLENEGFLTRTHGGAFIQQGVRNDVQFRLRESAYLESKKKIANLCIDYIRHGDSIYIDPSTTSLALCDLIKEKRITVVTNSLKVANRLSESTNITLIMVGGTFNFQTMSFEGMQAINVLSNYFFDQAFVSCRTLSLEYGITDSHESVSAIRSVAINRSQKTFIIADHSKYNRSSFIKICDFDDVDYLVCDKPLSKDWHKKMQEKNVKIIEGNL